MNHALRAGLTPGLRTQAGCYPVGTSLYWWTPEAYSAVMVTAALQGWIGASILISHNARKYQTLCQSWLFWEIKERVTDLVTWCGWHIGPLAAAPRYHVLTPDLSVLVAVILLLYNQHFGKQISFQLLLNLGQVIIRILEQLTVHQVLLSQTG